MNDKLMQAKELLQKYKQEHLLMFYDELSENKKQILLDNILRIDFEHINKLYQNSLIDEELNGEISPLPYFDKSAFSKEKVKLYKSIGIMALKRKEFAVVTLAGGQGSRLGHTGPKGTFELNLASKKKSLFEILCETLQKANDLYEINIPWYIMTSTANHSATIKFFEENNYFNYSNKNIHFFIQDKLPLIDTQEKLFLEEMYLIKEASNGNGNVYTSLARNGIIEDMKKQNIKWIFISGIDNVLVKLVDPFFLGLTISQNVEIATKSVFKEADEPKLSVFCRRNNKPDIINANEITEEMNNARDNKGRFLYRDANALCHLFSLGAIEKASNLELKYHRTFKKNTFINEEGMKQIPEKANSFKFEKFIFDAFPYFDNLLLLRVNKDKEFAPIKNLIDMNAATKLYTKSQNNPDEENLEI